MSPISQLFTMKTLSEFWNFHHGSVSNPSKRLVYCLVPLFSFAFQVM
jgi:hypothetical protein